LEIIDSVISKSYTQALETTFKPEWRRIIAWVDKRVFADVDIYNKEEFERARKTAEHILVFLKKWYKKVLIPEQVLAYPNLVFSIPVSDSEVSDEIQIVKLEEKPIIFDTNSVVGLDWQMYTDIDIRIRALLVADSLNCNSVIYHRIAMGELGGFNQNMIEIADGHNQRTRRVVTQVVKSIEKGVDFPSLTELCTRCPYRRRCKI